MESFCCSCTSVRLLEVNAAAQCVVVNSQQTTYIQVQVVDIDVDV